MKNTELYFKSIVRRWKKEIKDEESIKIFSPYITSKSAEIVIIDNIQPNNCKLYILFSAETFINGSSSIDTLIKLKKYGIKIFHIKNLHAKIVYIPNKFASIGSQNLTNRGNYNLEASVVFKEKNILNSINIHLQKIENEAKELTLENLLKMKELIDPLKKSYKLILKKSKDIDIELNNDLNESYIYNKNLLLLKKVTKNITKSSELVCGRIKEIDNQGWYDSTTISFVPFNKSDNLTIWNNNKNILYHSYRYLIIIENSGKLAWARVVKTRITFFGKGIHFTENKVFQYTNFSLKLIDAYAIWDKINIKKNNLKINIKPGLCNRTPYKS